MFMLVEIVVRNNKKKTLSSLNKLMPYRNTCKYLLVCEYMSRLVLVWYD